MPKRYRKLRGDTAYYPFAARTGLRARQRRHARALRIAGAAALILAAVLVAAALYALTMRSLVTLPTPDRWAEHIQRWGIAQF